VGFPSPPALSLAVVVDIGGGIGRVFVFVGVAFNTPSRSELLKRVKPPTRAVSRTHRTDSR